MEESVRRPLLLDAACSRVMDGLTGGAFLAGLALLVGANNFQLALLASLPFAAQVVQLPAVAVLLRIRDRRRVVVLAAGAARLLLLAIAAWLVMPGSRLTIVGLLGILFVSALLAVFATAAWNWWMRDLLPSDELGRFFGQRLRNSTLAGLAVMLLAGTALDWLQRLGRPHIGYAVLFAAGAAAGLLGIWALWRTPHVAAPPSPAAGQSLCQIVTSIRHAPRGLLPTLCLTTVAASFALPFSAVYLLRTLNYGYLAVTLLAAISQLAYLAGLRGWSYVSDRHGDRSLLTFSLSVLAASLLGWAITGWGTGFPLTAVLVGIHFVAGYAMGGIELASTNLLLRSSPATNVAAHLAGVSFVRAAAAGLGVLAAGLAWQALGTGPLATFEIPLIGPWSLRGFQVLCLASLGLTIASTAAVARLPTVEGSRTLEVARALRKEVHQMSSIAGIRGLIHAVSYYVEFMAAPFATTRRPAEPRGSALVQAESARADAGKHP